MPFLNTTPPTGGGGMLCNENWVSSHRRPFAIIFRELGHYPGFNEINSVLPDCIDTFILDILPVFGSFKFRKKYDEFYNLSKDPSEAIDLALRRNAPSMDLIKGRLDIAFMVNGYSAPVIQKLLRSKEVSPLSFERAEAIVRKNRQLAIAT